MHIIADMHCHTIASSHAYNTLFEMARAGKEAGLEMMAITDHGPGMPDAPHRWHFLNMRIWPAVIEGITVIPGVEANVKDFRGTLDLSKEYLRQIPWVIASCHREAITPGTRDDHTHMWLQVAKNRLVDLIGHCGQELYAFEQEPVIRAFGEHGKIVELNNNSAVVRPDSVQNCVEIAKLCKKYEVPVCVNTDAHLAYQVGRVERVQAMLEELDFPQELIFNADSRRITQYLAKKGYEYIPANGEKEGCG